MDKSREANQQADDLNREPEKGIGERVRQRRKEFEMTVEELAALTGKYEYTDQAGISVPTLYRYEKGERLPGAREIRLLSDALLVSPSWLLLGCEWDQEAEADAKLGLQFLALLGQAQMREQLGPRSGYKEMEHSEKLQQVRQQTGQ